MSGPPARPRAVVLVEGESDRRVLDVLARRLGRSLDGVRLVSLDGITNLRRVLADVPVGIPVLGLYDANERPVVSRALAAAGRPDVPVDADEAALDALGFFACTVDLEDELIRALGADGVVGAIAADGELGRFRTFQGQPAQRERPIEAQLRRFAGTASGRKHRFGAHLAELVPLTAIPRPLRALLDALPPEPGA